MAAIKDDDIVSGSRTKYLGRRYMVVVEIASHQHGALVQFSGSKFRVSGNLFNYMSLQFLILCSVILNLHPIRGGYADRD